MKTLQKCISFGIFCAVPALSQATLFSFDGLALGNYGIIPSNLGSNASAPVTGISIGSGWTPNVAVQMSTVDGTGTVVTPHVLFWDTNYGDLTDVAFASINGTFGRVQLTADPGFLVSINSFDLGGYSQTNFSADRIRIYDENGNVLWNQDGTTVSGSGPSHSSYFPNVTSQALTLEYGSNWNIGLDNLSVTQSIVPEPATLAMLSIGALGVIRKRRKTSR